MSTHLPPSSIEPAGAVVLESRNRTKLARPWGSLAIIAVMVLGGWVLESADGQRVHLRGFPAAVVPEVCWSKRWLGWACPLCGATRSVILVVQGRWADSWSMQPAGILVLLTAVLVAAISWMAFFLKANPQGTAALLTQALWLGLFIMLIIRHAAITAGWTESRANRPGTHAAAPSVR